MKTGDIRGDGHVTGDSYFILDVPHLLHGVVIFSFYFIFLKKYFKFVLASIYLLFLIKRDLISSSI